MKKTLLLLITLILLGFITSPSRAYEVGFIGNKVQGGLVIGQVTPGVKVNYKGQQIRVSEQGNFILGFDRDDSTNGYLHA